MFPYEIFITKNKVAHHANNERNICKFQYKNDFKPLLNLAKRTKINVEVAHEKHYDRNVKNNQVKEWLKHQLTSILETI